MAHDSFGGHNTKLFVPLLITLQKYSHHLLTSLYKFEILTLGKFKRSDFIVQHADVLVEICQGGVLYNTSLVTKSNTSEEFREHHFVHVVWA